MKKHKILTLLITASFATSALAQDEAREKIGLVLSGGGARGLAHLGVLKALEEQKIPIDYIAGTSAGALIGGMYASGMSVQEIEHQIKDLDLTAVSFAPADRRALKQNERNLDYQPNNVVDVSVNKGGKVALPIAVSNGAKVDTVLRDLLKNHPYDTDFQKLPIPFNAVAADLATGKMVVLKQGQLARALRASMSIPAVFAPVELNGQLLVDGMIDRNLPVDVVRQMGATRVIAVDVGSDLLKKEQLNSVVAVSEQMLGLLVKRNVDEQVATLTPRDILIRPQLGDIGNLAFKEGAKAAQLGYAAMQNNPKLASFSVPAATYTNLMLRHASPSPQNVRVDFVRIETHGLARPAALRQEIQMQDGQMFDLATVNADISRLMSAGRISNVTYKINSLGHQNELIYVVTEKDEARNSLRAGVEVTSNSLSDQQFTLHLAHRNTWLNSLGGEWRNHVSIGKRMQFDTQVNQPLTTSGRWFIRPSASIGYEKLPAYLSGSSTKTTEYSINRSHYGFIVGAPIARLGEWGLGLSTHQAHLRANNSNPNLIIPSDQQSNTTADAEITLDQMDNLFNPSSGYFIRAYGRLGLHKQAKHRYFAAGLQTQYAMQYKQHSMVLALDAGGQNSNNRYSLYLSPYALGGYHHLSGYANNQFIGNYMAYSSATYRYRSPWSILNNPLIFGASLEAGNTWTTAAHINMQHLKYSASLFSALNTPIGPAQLGIGLNKNGKPSFYFFLGRTFSDNK
ncbi:MAG: patatin-like phospholipase family protein [Formosimonas sp.]